MAVIRADAHVSDGSGKHADRAFSYASFEQLVQAMDDLRELNAEDGYYYRTADGDETYNLGLNKNAGSPRLVANSLPGGIARPYLVCNGEAPLENPGKATSCFYPRYKTVKGKRVYLRLTNCSGSTMTAMAQVLARGAVDAQGRLLPRLTEGVLPKAFSDYWNIVMMEAGDAAAKETWGQGSARAIQDFALGAQVDPLQMLRGDAIQLGSSSSSPLRGHSVYCFAVRRVRQGEVRFIFLSSQIDTFGVGVRLSDLARCGVLTKGQSLAPPTRRLKFRLQDEDGEPLADHRYQLQVGGDIFAGRTDAEGRLEVAIQGLAEQGELSFFLPDEDGEEECFTWPLKIRENLAPEAPPAQAQAPADEQGGAAPVGFARKEWVVQDDTKYQKYVYHPPDFDDPRFVTHAHRYGRWQVLTEGEQGKHTLFSPWSGHPHVARLNVEFPCYPLALGGSNELSYPAPPPAAGEGAAEGAAGQAAPSAPEAESVDVEQTSRTFYRNTEAMPGGFFPIGRSRVWHGGVHLQPDGDGTVYAPLDGRVVAARLCDPTLKDDAGEPRFPFGSGNFVLLKHRFELDGTQHELFSLLMHLAPVDLELKDEHRLLTPEAAKLPWLREIALAPDAEADKQEAEDLDWRYLYLKVYRTPPKKTVNLGDKPLAAGDILEVAQEGVTEAQWKTYHGLQAGPVKRVKDGAEGSFDGKKFNEDGGLVAPLDAYPFKFIEAKKKLREGEVVDLWKEEIIVRCGEPIGQTGEWHGQKRLHVELFSKDLIPMKVSRRGSDGAITWAAKEAVDCDTAADNKCYYDRKAFLEKLFTDLEGKINEEEGLDGEERTVGLVERMLGSSTASGDKAILKESELQAFFNDGTNSLLPFFRNLVVRHLSEWGTKVQWENLHQAKDSLGKPLELPLRKTGEQAAKYAWWTDGFGEEAGLPADQVAHYYHPITFLLWLDHERQLEVPKGAADALHKSIIDLNHAIEGPEGGAAAQEQSTDTKKLRFCLRMDDGDVLGNCRYELKVNGQTFSGTTDPEGRLEHDVPKDATEGELKFWLEDDGEEEEPYNWPLKIA